MAMSNITKEYKEKSIRLEVQNVDKYIDFGNLLIYWSGKQSPFCSNHNVKGSYADLGTI